MIEMDKADFEMQSLVSVLHFTTKILCPKYAYAIFPFFSTLYMTYCNRRKRVMKKLVQPIPQNMLEDLIVMEEHCKENLDNCVLIKHNILQVIGVENGSWVKMKSVSRKPSLDVKQDGTLSKQDSCFVRIFGVPDLEESVVLINDRMYYNLKSAHILAECSKSYVILEAISRTFHLKSSQINCTFKPNIATTATIGLIQTPLEVGINVLDTVLKSYFTTPHYLAKGDVFSVDVIRYSPEVYYSPGNQNIKILHFVVVDIEGPKYEGIPLSNIMYGYYIVKNITTLLQSSNIQRYLPTSSVHFMNNPINLTAQNYKSFVLNICPSGLDSYYEQLIGSFKPFLLKDKEVHLKPLFLLFGPQGAGKREIVACAARTLGIGMWNVDCLDLQGNTPGYTEGKLKFIFNKVPHFSPCILLLANIEALCKDKDGNEDSRVISSFLEEVSKLYNSKIHTAVTSDFPVLVVGVCNTNSENMSAVAPALARAFLHVIRFSSPGESQRAAMLEWLIGQNGLHLHAEVSLEQLAAHASGFLFADLAALIGHAVRNSYKYLKKKINPKGDQIALKLSELVLRKEDFEDALEMMHAAYADSIGAPKIPAVSWNDVGGLMDVKDEILSTINLPLQHPELAASGLHRSGLLLFGPPGTGKTLLAKAVATECSLNFLSVKGPELLNMYVGQSEENVREVFQRARSASPCIIFFDELDSLAPNRGRSGDSGGVMDRVVSQLLAEMDGLQKSSHLFVIGATNRPDLIDPALLRPGRFDKLLYVGACEDKTAQLSVLTALTRKFHLKPGVNLSSIASSLPNSLTGADLYSVCSNAWLNAVRTQIQQLEEVGEVTPVEVGAENFKEAIASLVPSVSTEDLHYFQKMQQQIVNQ